MRNKYIFRLSVYMVLMMSITVLGGQDIKVMTYNIRYDNSKDGDNWWEHRKDEVVKLVQHYHPEFLGIQEGLIHQVEFIKANSSDYNFVGVGRDDGIRKGEYTAIFYDVTKFELVSTNTFWLSETPEEISVGWDASMERICTYGKFIDRASNKSLFVFNAHLDHRGPESRKMAARLMIKKINDLVRNNSPVVLMGDFNCQPGSDPFNILLAELDDGIELSTQPFYGPHGTFNGFDTEAVLDRRIDYIFSKNLEIHSYRHIDDRRKNQLWVSDHLPVLSAYKWHSN